MTVAKNDIHFEKTYVVRINRKQRVLRGLGLLAIIFLLPLAAYIATSIYLGNQERQLSDQVASQQEQISFLRQELSGLEQQAANSELASEVDRNSLEQMRKEMVQSQARIEFLGEQIRFYQSLMDPNPEKGGVYLESVDFEPSNQLGEYHYNIVIAQRSSNHRRVQGTLDLQVIAQGQGETDQTFGLSELTERQETLPLGFKFFQQLDGNIRLPEGVVPTSVRVTVRLNGDASPRVDETFEWNS